jgi:hypothetical protein
MMNGSLGHQRERESFALESDVNVMKLKEISPRGSFACLLLAKSKRKWMQLMRIWQSFRIGRRRHWYLEEGSNSDPGQMTPRSTVWNQIPLVLQQIETEQN